MSELSKTAAFAGGWAALTLGAVGVANLRRDAVGPGEPFAITPIGGGAYVFEVYGQFERVKWTVNPDTGDETLTFEGDPAQRTLDPGGYTIVAETFENGNRQDRYVSRLEVGE